MTLVLAGAYAGWAGSLPADVIEQRLQQALRLADLPPAQLVEELPAGLPATSRAFAEADLRDVLPDIAVPALLLYGDKDVRAPQTVARDLHAGIPGSRPEVMEGVGHVSSVEAAERFTSAVRAFLRSVQG